MLKNQNQNTQYLLRQHRKVLEQSFWGQKKNPCSCTCVRRCVQIWHLHFDPVKGRQKTNGMVPNIILNGTKNGSMARENLDLVVHVHMF
jgi:hypothetical protein